MQALVSIITPTFNNELSLYQTVCSVLDQSYPFWELIIIDDGSTDKSFKIAKQLELQDKRIKVLRNIHNKGTAEARNYGTSCAKGDFIAFLDADDLWHPTKLEKQLPYLDQFDICYSAYDLMDESGRDLKKKVHVIKELTLNKLLRANYIGNLTGIYNARKLGKIYTIDLRKRQDWLLWIKALKISDKPAIGIEESLATYRVRGNSLSSNKWQLLHHNYKVYRLGMEYPTIKAIGFTLRFIIEHFLIKSRMTRSISY